MRARTIKPGFYDNELLGSASPLAHLLFPGLWMLADHEGRLEYRPKRIKVKIFPYRDADVAELCDELIDAGMVIKYTNEGNEYLYIPSFKDHQRPHPNEKKNPSVLPAYANGDNEFEPDTHQGTNEDAPKTYQGASLDVPNRAGSSGPSGSSGSTGPTEPLLDDAVSPTTETSPDGPKFPSPIEVFREAWNAMAAKHGLPQCREMTGKRKTEFTARWKDPGWRRDYPEALAKVPASQFLLGKNDRGWKANIEWFLRPDSLTKILEDNYGGNRSLSIASPDDSAGLF